MVVISNFNNSISLTLLCCKLMCILQVARGVMGDDYRENEGAKLVMEDHNMLHLRTFNLKKEILNIKKQLIGLRTK